MPTQDEQLQLRKKLYHLQLHRAGVAQNRYFALQEIHRLKPFIKRSDRMWNEWRTAQRTYIALGDLLTRANDDEEELRKKLTNPQKQ
jgi:hypothetical protein